MRRPASAILTLLTLALTLTIARTAWMSDDAFITLRTLENLLAGHGLRYNPAERVQAFTHPLWVAWIAAPYAITREPWLTIVAVGALTTLVAVGVAVVGVARTPAGAGLALCVLLGSKAWVDYATSGLENPLVWLLLAVFVRELVRGGAPGRLVLAAALVALTRLDVLAIVLPALVLVGFERWRAGERRALAVAQLGWLPLVAWHLFALAYYGSWAPNTAWAKLGTGISALDLAAQSVHYFSWTARNDPVTLPAIAVGLAAGLASRDRRAAALAVGAGLYLLYVVRIGGDFMGGRFFTAPLWIAALLLARTVVQPRVAAALGAAAVFASLVSPYAPLRSGPGYTRAQARHGVVDERGFFWYGTGVFGETWRWSPTHDFAEDGRAARRTEGPVVVKSVIGLYGYYAGPQLHVVDRLGLSDPLLARRPAESRKRWRIGHFRREIPAGYLESLPRGDNLVEDREIRALYRDVRLATRAPLWSARRWKAILRLEARAWR